MTTFVGRDRELGRLRNALEDVSRTGRGQFVWVRGRRRVGKSRLVQEFCDRSGLPYCFFQAPQRPRAESLQEFAEAARESSLSTAEDFNGVTFSSWSAALRAAASPEHTSIVVIDELPYLTANDPGFAADLQKAWDRYLEHSATLLICIGSDVRMMAEMLGERAPLYGRPTAELSVDPLTPAGVAQITGARDATEAIDRYLLVGGFPLLAARWKAGVSVKQFLKAALVDDDPLVTTGLRIMASEFESEVSARRVIEAIGHGESAHKTISSRAGVAGNTLSAALATLVDAKRVVARQYPYAAPGSPKLTKYTVKDPYLRFWLRFIGPHVEEISRGRGDLTASRILRDWNSYRGRAVEPVVRDALGRLLADPPLADRAQGATVVGSWWNRTHQTEVDIVAGDAVKATSVGLIGSIKWHERELFSAAEMRALLGARAVVPGAAGARTLVVSRTAVAEGVNADIVLGPDDVLSAWT